MHGRDLNSYSKNQLMFKTKRYAYKRVELPFFVTAKDGTQEERSAEDVLNWHCANRDSEWEVEAILKGEGNKEVIYLKKEVKW